MKKLLIIFLFLLCFIVFADKIVFWTAPNPLQEEFWKPLIEEWNNNHPDVQIDWKTIPAAGSSEEAILTAVAAGSAPDFCTNIFSGFAAQLAEQGIIVSLDEEYGQEFFNLVKTRNMEKVIEGWKLGDHYYVFPIYSNPILMWWRKDKLLELGFDTPPRTYSDIYEVAKKYADPPDRYAMQVVQGRNWWDRWFDFITYYYAASSGKSYIDTKRYRASFNDEYGKSVAKFIYTMFKNKWTAVEMGNQFSLSTGKALGVLQGPWSLNWAKNTYPEVYKNIWISPPPVPDNYNGGPIKTFADTKGLVVFSHSKYKKEIFEFIKWVFGNSENDVRWIEITKMPPAREDLTTNPLFEKFMNDDPYFAAYAKEVGNAIPPALVSNTIDVQDAMTVYLIEPLMYLKSTPEDAINKCVKEINKILY
ncbi:sugar ABC transporter [Thermosipho africanus H17ap60334]|jgi:multiple sugar transport system substrate-binding protein|uniref:extracellular solute-binding protein n=1 Tax=Thermosipho TaxID=2420 RepID=UPI00028D05E2|nr:MULTISPECIES: extracellular solute-binding protein [Thermosipho]EKF49158.1 sugar ABC transporter [Thermosipho africanus H17ap60334]MBZ4649612.1 sugar transporter [Thermosipho sp. (in: thermotogales)]MDK2839968.1 multiple sugar transport system substrate-binding protein [Thermosipho sp. (in: thermotogales)]